MSDQPLSDQPLPAKGTNWFSQHWRGELSLVKSFWINLVAMNIIVNNAMRIAGGDPEFTSAAEAAGYAFGMIMISALIAIWQYTGVWRSANAYRRAGRPVIWAILAQAVVILGILVHIALPVVIILRAV